MAAPKDSPEQAFRLRKFQGTATELDSTFLGPSFLQRTQNWIPTQSYRLGKRPGTALLQNVGLSTSRITHLNATHDPNGVAYLFAYCLAGSGAQVNQSVSEGGFSACPGVAFASPNPGRTITFRNRVYAGNGVDPMKSWVIGETDNTKVQIYAALVLDPPATTPAATPGIPAGVARAVVPAGSDEIPTGTYSYAWGRFDKNSGLYIGRTDAQQATIPPQSSVVFTAPPGALGTNQVYRLFVSPRNYPIEYATMQADSVLAGATTASFSSFDVSDTRCPIAAFDNQGRTLVRTGNMFLIWRNRVVFAGSQNDPYSVFSTDVILPGLEQSVFNQGTFFPVDAKVPLPHRVTGIGVAGVTSDQDAQSPLLFFTESQTFLAMGDPFDSNDLTAQLIEISSRVGCVGHGTIVNTPYGTLFVAMDSVYLIPPGGGYPQNIGWPIADQIRAIPVGLRATLIATFHKQFYKLIIPSPGSASNTQQWWLDLRQGVQDQPSWWGPHSIGASTLGEVPIGLSAITADPSSTLEVDRGYAAHDASDRVILHHQVGLNKDYYPGLQYGVGVASILFSGRFDADQPFIAKVITRLRLIAQVAATSPIQVRLLLDNGKQARLDDIVLGLDMDPAGEFTHTIYGDPPYPPVYQEWSTTTMTRAVFGSIAPAEAQTITPFDRPRCLSLIVVLTHAPKPEDDPQQRGAVPGVELRDFELLYIPSERKVRYVGERVSI
jgi:hypothetical protein